MKHSNKDPKAHSTPDWLIGGGEMGEMIRSMDWSATPVGPRADWPQVLKVTTNLALSSSFPMAILWGKDLIFVYNDAYRVIAAEKHPNALGRSNRDVWPEVWEFNRRIFEKVMLQGQTVHLEDQLFRIHRQTYPEDAYFTLSYSPLWMEDGTVGGTLVILLETTRRINAERAQMERIIEEKNKLSALIDSIPDEVWFADSEKKVTLLNPAVFKEFGPEGIAGERTENVAEKLEVFRPDGTPRPIDESPLLRSLRGEILTADEEIIRTPVRGEMKYRQVSAAPVRDGSGNVIGSVSVVRDITERKKAEEALRDYIRLLDDVIDGSTSPIFLKDQDGRFITINASLEKMLGKSRQELKGKTDYDIAPKDVADCWRSHDAKVMATGKAIQIEEVADLQDGHHIFLANKFPLLNTHGQVYGVGAISHDITDRKKMEEELRASEERLRSILHNMSEGLMLFDAGGNLIYQNPASLRIHGFGAQEDGRIEHENLPITWKAWDDQGRPITFAEWPVSRVFRHERFQDQVLRVIRVETGQEFYGSYNGSPIYDAEGKFEMGFITIRDITENKRAEQALRNARDELDKRVRERTAQLQESEKRSRQLSSELIIAQETERKRIAHELHDSLAAQLAAVKYRIEHRSKNGESVESGMVDETIKDIQTAITEIRRIMSNLRPSVLDDLGIVPTLTWYSRETGQAYPGTSIEYSGNVQEPDIPENLKIVIFRVCQESIANAVRHGKSSLIQIWLEKEGSWLRLRIADNGRGFDSIKKSETGGIGMDSMQQRVDSTGGIFSITSTSGQGTTVKAEWRIG